jgi:hypothetical protein
MIQHYKGAPSLAADLENAHYWVDGNDPMTYAQLEDLKTLCVRSAAPAAFSEKLSKAEASKRIDALKAKLDQTGVSSN